MQTDVNKDRQRTGRNGRRRYYSNTGWGVGWARDRHRGPAREINKYRAGGRREGETAKRPVLSAFLTLAERAEGDACRHCSSFRCALKLGLFVTGAEEIGGGGVRRLGVGGEEDTEYH